ncbi:MAG: hypothetical protein GY713_20315 [Actinomycetia bacterium]|nr:hypothetical protein [Actinomycetes bacterium]
MSFDSITNRGEFFSNHYLDAILGNDLGDLRKQWDEAEAEGQPTARSGLRSLPDPFFTARAVATEAGPSTRVDAIAKHRQVVFYGPPGTGKTFVARTPGLGPQWQRRLLSQLSEFEEVQTSAICCSRRHRFGPSWVPTRWLPRIRSVWAATPLRPMAR